MKVLLLTTLTMLMLVSTVSVVSAQNITSSLDDCFNSNADFCFDGNDYIANPNHKDKDNNKGVYACNVITDSDKFCKKNLAKNEQKQKDNNKQSSGTGKITVGYGDVGSYYGKGKVVIKNEDNGKILVVHDLNFAKQHHNQGPDCCVKVYTFDKSKAHYGDTISAKVTGGGGSWESGAYSYKNNLKMSIILDEIGQ